MRTTRERGFSLIELAITILVLGILISFSVPAFLSLNQTNQLAGASENLAAQLRLAREKAIATGVEQPLHVVSTTTYHIHYSSYIGNTWNLPRGISFANIGGWYRMQKDGRCSGAGLIVLRDARGFRDTVSVQASGLVLTQ